MILWINACAPKKQHHYHVTWRHLGLVCQKNSKVFGTVGERSPWMQKEILKEYSGRSVEARRPKETCTEPKPS